MARAPRRSYQEGFRPLYLAGLRPRHVALSVGMFRDLFPLNKRADVVNMCLHISNMCSRGNSPRLKHHVSFTRAKEDDPIMHGQYAVLDEAYAALAKTATAESEGIEIELTPPANAAYCPPELRGVKGVWTLHFPGPWYEMDDSKMLALLARCANGSAATAIEGGLRYDVSKKTKLRPLARIVESDDPTKRDGDYIWHSSYWFTAKVTELREWIATETEKNGHAPSHKHVKDFCTSKGHSFTQALEPYLAVRKGLWDPLHLDNNLAQYTLELYDKLAFDLQEHLELKYSDPRSPRRKLHMAMRATGRRLGRHADALERRANGEKEMITFRLCGDDTIDWFCNSWRWDDALVCPTEKDRSRYWWLQRGTLAVRVHLHRTLSYYQVRYTLQERDVDIMIKLGELYQFLLYNTGCPCTYSDSYLSKGNPYGLKRLIPEIRIADENNKPTGEIHGVANVAGAQGGERYNAFDKVTYPMLTSGRPGSERAFLEVLFTATLAHESGEFGDRAFDYHKNSRARWPEEVGENEEAPPSAAAAAGGGGGGGGSGEAARGRGRGRGSRGGQVARGCGARAPRARKPFDGCSCGRPSVYGGLTRAAHQPPLADVLRLGKPVCVTCCLVSTVMHEVCREVPIGASASVMKLAKYAAMKLTRDTEFNLADIARSKLREEEEVERERVRSEAMSQESTTATASAVAGGMVDLEGNAQSQSDAGGGGDVEDDEYLSDGDDDGDDDGFSFS